MDLGVEHKIVEKGGALYNYGILRLGQGRENAKSFLCENLDLVDELDFKLRGALNLPTGRPVEEAVAVGKG